MAIDLKFIKYSQIIKDPFPEHSAYESLSCGRSLGEKFWRSIMGEQPPEFISIWAAYKIGYDKAYEEIENALKNKELKDGN